MVYLDKPQKQFLIKLLKTDSIDCTEMSSDQLAIVKYFDDLGFLTADRAKFKHFNSKTEAFESIPREYISVKISEKGKSYFAERRSEYMRFLIPVTISLCALVISVFSLLS